MMTQNITIDDKEYTVRSADWDGETLKEAAAQLEQGILYYKKSKDELSAVVLAALAFAYDSVSKSKSEQKSESESENGVLAEAEEALKKILQKISIHIQSPKE